MSEQKEDAINNEKALFLMTLAGVFDVLSLVSLIPLVGWLLGFMIGLLGGIVFFVVFRLMGQEYEVRTKDVSSASGLTAKFQGRMQAALLARLSAMLGEMVFLTSWLPLFSISTALSIFLINGKSLFKRIGEGADALEKAAQNLPIGELRRGIALQQAAIMARYRQAEEEEALQEEEGRQGA